MSGGSISKSRSVSVIDTDYGVTQVFPSITQTIEWLMDLNGECWHTMTMKFYHSLKTGEPLLGYTFFVEGNYVRSRAMCALNTHTGDLFFTPSVNRMAEMEFGCNDPWAIRKVRYYVSNGCPTLNENILSYVNDSPNIGRKFTSCPGRARPVFKLDRTTGCIIGYFSTLTSAAQHVRDSGLSRPDTSVTKVSCHIIRCCKGHQRCVSAYGFKWRYVRHDEPPESEPLPEPDAEGL